MNEISAIDSYVSLTRRNRNNIVNRIYYNDIFSSLSELMRDAGIESDFRIVHSTALRCEVITTDNISFLIYDQNIGQVFNQFNRIIFESDDRNAGLLYIHKVVAQLMSNFDNLVPEALFAISYYNNKRKIIPKSSNTLNRLNKTIMQEVYILAHEVMHHIYSKKDHRYHKTQFVIDALCDQYIEASDSAYGLSPEDVAKRHLEFPEAALGEGPDYGSDMQEEQKLFRQQVRNELSAPGTKEEIFCDFWAAMWTLAVFREKGMDCLEAIFLAHFHLRVLTELSYDVRRYADMIELLPTHMSQQRHAAAFVRSRINLELCSFLPAALELLNHLPGTEGKLVGDVVFLAFSNIRLSAISRTPMPDFDIEVDAIYETSRCRFIRMMATYYEKLYDHSNSMIYNGLRRGSMRSAIEENLRGEGSSLDELRNEIGDPELGREYKHILDLMLA